jgi:hypothetical protein
MVELQGKIYHKEFITKRMREIETKEKAIIWLYQLIDAGVSGDGVQTLCTVRNHPQKSRVVVCSPAERVKIWQKHSCCFPPPLFSNGVIQKEVISDLKGENHFLSKEIWDSISMIDL